MIWQQFSDPKGWTCPSVASGTNASCAQPRDVPGASGQRHELVGGGGTHVEDADPWLACGGRPVSETEMVSLVRTRYDVADFA